ncbi:dTDP-L-rhamnose 4-epimerase [Methylobrevis pamukkalensis]|uniref:dTDP-L-rhamnose 4-epimerase n=1 Tax=Methylobrevis pamukkalensis TaxID=1439726 RepID=A0A1E3GX08_9HYPH|nr:dTDP-L-rhamnose 4-epimerase [Methylobrevis pamukkalensis]
MSKTYLVTGGAGFIGRHLCLELLAAGCEVKILDALIPQVHRGRDMIADLPSDIAFIEGDIRDPQAVRTALDGVDGVFHLAAEVGVGQSMYEIDRYVGVNDLGTAVLLQALVEKPVRRIVVASSMSVYGEGRYVDGAGRPVPAQRRTPADIERRNWDIRHAGGETLRPAPTDEEKPVDLASIYALTKYVQERAVLLFAEAYRREAVALRLFNVFGPGQALSNPYTGVLANFSSRIAAGERPMVFEDGLQRRDFVHVRDVARAFCLAMEAPAANGHVITSAAAIPMRSPMSPACSPAPWGATSSRRFSENPGPATSATALRTSTRRAICSASHPRTASRSRSSSSPPGWRDRTMSIWARRCASSSNATASFREVSA